MPRIYSEMSKPICMIKSPLRYPGGKSRAASLIASLAPDFQAFREPFLGGGSVFVHLKQQFPNRQFWGNDVYEELYLFWKHAQTNLDALVAQVQTWRNMFQTGKEMYAFLNANMDSFNDLEKASAFFIFNRITFSGTTLSGGYSEQAFKGRFTESSIARLAPFADVIRGATLTNVDYADVVMANGENVFIFLDPPYYSATKSALYGKNGHLHKAFDHDRFAETMRQCPHKWLITYDDSPYIRERFSFAHIMSWDLMYGMRNINTDSDQIGKEVFISNYLTELPK